jgi:hypothetical protein
VDADEPLDSDAVEDDAVADEPGEQLEAEKSAEESDDAIGPLDQLGIPMSRKPTIDDVRSDGEAHRRMAVGCSVAVGLALLAFWLVRAVLLG